MTVFEQAPARVPSRPVFQRQPHMSGVTPGLIDHTTANAARFINGPRFDFGSIPVFANASTAPDTLGVPAYTKDAAVHLATDFYSRPEPLRQRILLHEMAHAVQQSGGNRSEEHAPIGAREAEAEANVASQAALNGRTTALSAVKPSATLGWDSFEHVAIGEAGEPKGRYFVLNGQKRDLPNYQRPPAEWAKPWQDVFNDPKTTSAQKRAMQQGLSYGEILALSGDFYGGSGQATSDEATIAFKRLDEASFMEVIKLIPLIRSAGASTHQLEEATGGRYLTLAKRNLSHFSRAGVDATGAPRNNLGVWKKAHTQALLAAQSGDTDTAWAMNAAADHFLTDAFSSGHTREDREHLLGSPVKAKAIHDLDNEHGVDVANTRGDHWTAYGDDFWTSKNNARNRELALEAESLSKADIANAVKAGAAYVVPKSFAAEAIVPTPVDVNKTRWGTWDKIKEYAHLAKSELPGIIASTWTDDNDVRAWAASNSAEAIARQPLDERIRMVHTLLSGIITDADVRAIEKILSKSPELREFQARFGPELNSINNHGYRARVRIAMGF
jgi:hypothetical protein